MANDSIQKSPVVASITYGYEKVISYPKTTISYTVAGTFIDYFFFFIVGHVPKNPVWFVLIFLLQTAVYFYIYTALAKIALRLAENQPTNDDPLSSIPSLEEYVGLACCIAALMVFIIIGFFAFVLPGIYITLRYGMSFWILLEENNVSVNKFRYSLQRSSDLTAPKGVKFTIFVILFAITLFFHILSVMVSSYGGESGLFLSSLIRSFEFVFQTVILAQVYVQLKSSHTRKQTA